MRLRIAILAAAFALSACKSMGQQDTPALILGPATQGHAELVRAVSAALGVATVTIADDALTRESTLVIERRPARDATGQRLSGRDFDPPDQFELVRSGGRCVLIHQKTGQRYALAKTRCRPASLAVSETPPP